MSYSNYDQTVIINGHRLLGVQGVDGSYGISEKPVRVAGVGFVDAIVNTPLEGNFSIKRKMVGRDPLLETDSLGKYIFDEQEIDGVIAYDDNSKGFGFTRGRVSRYSVTCRVGEVPDIQTDIVVYGDLGKNVLAETAYFQDLNSIHYTFTLDQEYDYFKVCLANLQTIEGWESYSVGRDVTEEWRAGELYITQEEYDSLYSTTKFSRRERRVRGASTTIYSAHLGKDSFVLGDERYINSVKNLEKEIEFPDQSSIKLIVSDFSIDAVLDFSYSRSINVLPVYALARGGEAAWNAKTKIDSLSLEPVQIDTQYPIETDITVTMIANEYQVREIKDRLQNAPKSNVAIQICDAKDHSNVINSFVGKNVRLISESINSTTEEEMNITLSYKSYESYHNQIL